MARSGLPHPARGLEGPSSPGAVSSPSGVVHTLHTSSGMAPAHTSRLRPCSRRISRASLQRGPPPARRRVPQPPGRSEDKGRGRVRDPVRPARTGVVASSEQQMVARCEGVLLDPLVQHGDEHRRDRHSARPGLWFAGLVKGDVSFGDVETPPTFGRQIGRSDSKHHHLRWPQARVVGNRGQSRDTSRCPLVLRDDRVDCLCHRGRAQQRAFVDVPTGASDLWRARVFDRCGHASAATAPAAIADCTDTRAMMRIRFAVFAPSGSRRA